MVYWKIKKTKLLAFTLVEVAVYFSLFLVFTIVAMRFSCDVREFALFLSREDSRLLRKQLLFDVIFKDVVSASGDRVDWDEENFVFNKTTVDGAGQICRKTVGFFVKNKSVVRYEGEYDFKNSLWIKKSTSVIGKGVIDFWHELDFYDKSKRKVKGVMVTIDSFQYYIRIRNCVL